MFSITRTTVGHPTVPTTARGNDRLIETAPEDSVFGSPRGDIGALVVCLEGTLLALKRPILLPTPTSRDSVVVIVAVCLPDDISKSLRVVCSASGKGLGGRGGGVTSAHLVLFGSEREIEARACLSSHCSNLAIGVFSCTTGRGRHSPDSEICVFPAS